MFEKEAEKWRNNLPYEIDNDTFYNIVISCIEFGYNKANEEDKWHYPSKGELPKCDEETQLIFYVNCYYEVDGETFTRKRTVLGFYKKSFLNDDVKLFVEKSKGYEAEHLPKDVIA